MIKYCTYLFCMFRFCVACHTNKGFCYKTLGIQIIFGLASKYSGVEGFSLTFTDVRPACLSGPHMGAGGCDNTAPAENNLRQMF